MLYAERDHIFPTVEGPSHIVVEDCPLLLVKLSKHSCVMRTLEHNTPLKRILKLGKEYSESIGDGNHELHDLGLRWIDLPIYVECYNLRFKILKNV